MRRGDEHEWIVWHGLAPFSAYGRETYRFVSEFGFESLPALATVAAFAPDPDDWNLGSPLLDHHQRCPAGNARILYYMAQQFRLPRDFDGLIYLSQVLQAEAMRVGVEHWRRERARCGGTLFWQLNDCWPVSSWSSIDYFGRWKALHYATRRFYAPVLLSCSVAGEAASGKAGNGVTATLSVTNDLPRAWRGEIRWTLERLDGEVVATGSMPVEAPGLATTSVCSVDVPVSIEDRRSQVLVAELLEAGSSHALVVTPFVPDKHLALRPPEIDARVEPKAPPSRPELSSRPNRPGQSSGSDPTRWPAGSSSRLTAPTSSSATTTSTSRLAARQTCRSRSRPVGRSIGLATPSGFVRSLTRTRRSNGPDSRRTLPATRRPRSLPGRSPQHHVHLHRRSSRATAAGPRRRAPPRRRPRAIRRCPALRA